MHENQVQEVARHTGHELSVHRKFYRLQEDVIELAKISKLLLAVESGKAHKFKGVSLDDLDLNDIPDVDDNAEMDTVSETPTDTVSKTPVDKVSETPMDTVSKTPMDMVSETPMDTVSETSTDTVSETPMDTVSETPKDTVSEIPMNMVSETPAKSRKQPVRLTKHKQNPYEFDEKDPDDDRDPDYKDGHTDSSDSSDEEPVVKKRKKTEKKKWTEEEKGVLAPLVLQAYREGKPPNKASVDAIIQKNHILKNLKWLSIKYQVWALAQQKLKARKEILK